MDLAVGVATEAATSFLAKIIKDIAYIFKYKQNLQSLKDAAKNLDAKRTDATRFLEDTKRKQKDVSSTAASWQSESDELYENAKKINSSENNISCLNLWSRYSTSKHASELALEIDQKLQTAPDFGTAFDRPLPESGAKFNLAGFMEFKSRESVVNDVLEALKDVEVSMCSIVGMGGTGKTTLAKMLVQRVETDRLFDKVAMVTVSQNPNFEKVQNEIIELLGLKFSESTMSARATRLNKWLTDDKSRTLLILDDVWFQLKNEDFENIGIPSAVSTRDEGNCKIVVTSRNEDECRKMGSQRNFLIKVLDEEEGWDLFKHIAGKCVDRDLNLQRTAKEIAHKCGGLPMVILTLAAALKDKPKGVWKDSLLKLKNSNVVGISGMTEVYSRLQLSYDLLTDSEAKACFRLCCLFPEDHNIPTEYFVWFGKGLRLFENADSICETRDRVETIVDKLKKSFLLLDGKKDDCVKMHDVLRDFAISISSKNEHPYILGFEKVMEKWPETDQYENCSAISFICDKINEHPLDLRCPKLELLQVLLDSDDHQIGLPSGIFEGLNALRVLVLKVPPLSQSLAMLKELRTLIIGKTERWDRVERVNNIGDLLGRYGDLKNLEILAISSCKPCDDFPAEIGLLCNLRILKISYVKFKYIAPGILSKLVKLEELELSNGFYSWGCKDVGGGRSERFNAGLDEIESLPLTTLKISVAKGSIFAEKLVDNLTKFVVNVGSGSSRFSYDNSNAKSVIQFVYTNDVIANWMNVWVRKCERFQWTGVHNVTNIMTLQSFQENGVPQWKELKIYACHEMEYLLDTIAERIPSSFFSQVEKLELKSMNSLEDICPFSKIEEAPCFSNLRDIYIWSCPNLKHVFPLSVARGLRQLQHIRIQNCVEMEEIFYKLDEGDDTQHQITEETIAKVEEKEVDHPIIFSQLKTMMLGGMSKLRILYDGNHAIELPSLDYLSLSHCDKMEGLSHGSFNAPRLKQININGADCPAEGEDLNAIVKKNRMEVESSKTRSLGGGSHEDAKGK